eukprot:UN29247
MNVLLGMYAKWGDYNGVFKTLAKMKLYEIAPNQASFDSAISNGVVDAFIKDNNIEAAWSFFDEMLSFGFRPSPATYLSLTSGLAKNGDTNGALHSIDRANRDGIVFSSKVY